MLGSLWWSKLFTVVVSEKEKEEEEGTGQDEEQRLESTRRLPVRLYLLKVPPILNNVMDWEGQTFNI